MKKNIAIVRGRFLNKFEMQFYEPLAKEFNLTGFGSLSCFHNQYKFPVVKLFSPVDVPDFPYKMPILNRIFIDANYLFGLEKQISGFDIAHPAETYYRYTIQCLDAKQKGLVKKVVVSVYENIPFAGEGIKGRKAFKKRVFNEADHFIAVSQKTKDALLKEGCSNEKITIINQHIDTERFMPIKKINMKEITILFTGRMEFYKGIFDFIKAAKIIISDKEIKNKLIKFIMVGEGSDKNNALKMENEYGIANFFKHYNFPYEEMPKIYQKADIYIAPSRTTKHWQEQFSTVLLEAKASGLPIISTNTGGIPENVGKAGILVNEGDYKTIAKEALNLIINPHKRFKMGTVARQDALNRFTINKGAKKVKEVYQKVLMS